MSRSRVEVTEKRADGLLPSGLCQGVVMMEYLAERGVISEVAERLRIYRKGGYSGPDAFGFLALYHGSGWKCGLKRFEEETRPYGRELAGLSGRERWPRQASVCRLLGSVEEPLAQGFADWLLGEALPASVLDTHPSITTRDCLGEPWHVLHYDPTVLGMRQRKLAEGEEYPKVVRLAKTLAVPGYPGRKRCQTQMSRGTLQHGGSSRWLQVSIAPGNGDMIGQARMALEAATRWNRKILGPAGRCLMAMDGGLWGAFLQLFHNEAGIHLVSRCSYLELLNEERVRGQLVDGKWSRVASSGSGPVRYAMELGNLVTKDGATPRMVVTRFEIAKDDTRKSHGAGIDISGWHYELFATTTKPDAWPAPELVTVYYGRCGQENRYAQEDNEVGLDRVYHFKPGGQLLATAIGLFVWNLRRELGARLVGPLAEQGPPLEARLTAEVILPGVGVESDDALVIQSSVADSGQDAESTVSPAPSEESDSLPQSGEVSQDEAVEPDVRPGVSTGEPHEGRLLIAIERPLPRCLVGWCLTPERLSQFDWNKFLLRRPGWEWDAAGGGPRCPDGRTLRPSAVEPRGNYFQLRFTALEQYCTPCSRRGQCTGSGKKRFAKSVKVSLTAEEGELLRERTVSGPHPGTPQPSPPRPRFISPTPKLLLPGPEPSCLPGPWQSQTPYLVPTVLRDKFLRLCLTAVVYIFVPEIPFVPPLPDYLAYPPARRQRRRKTWQELLDWNALPDHISIRVKVASSGTALQLQHLLNLVRPTTSPHPQPPRHSTPMTEHSPATPAAMACYQDSG